MICKKNKMRTQISEEKFKELMIDAINSGNNCINTKSNFYEYVRTDYKIERQRCLRLYDRYYNQLITERNKLKTEYGIKNEESALDALLLDKTRRLRIAEKIALGVAKLENGEKRYPSFSDRIKALDYIAKVEGDYATISTKVEGDLYARLSLEIGEVDL